MADRTIRSGEQASGGEEGIRVRGEYDHHGNRCPPAKAVRNGSLGLRNGNTRVTAHWFGCLLAMPTFDVGTQPSDISRFIQRTCSHSENGLGGIFLTGFEVKAVQFEKQNTDCEADPFVAVNKRMVANQASRVQASQLDEVGRTVGVMLARPGEG